MAKRAKGKRLTKKLGGPFLAGAFFCETVLTDTDGSLSAIRIVDTISLTLPPSAPANLPSEEQSIPFFINGVLILKTGDSPGNHVIRIAAESPSGKIQVIFEQPVQLPPEPQGGINLRLNQTIGIHAGGLFWLHVFLDGKRIARMPLVIKIQRLEVDPGQPAGTQNA